MPRDHLVWIKVPLCDEEVHQRPVYMNRTVKLPGDGKVVRAFGFAEGADYITAFWEERIDGAKHYFCQRTEQMARGG